MRGVCAVKKSVYKNSRHSSSTAAAVSQVLLAFVPVAAVYACVVGAQQEIEPRQQYHVRCSNQTHIVGPSGLLLVGGSTTEVALDFTLMERLSVRKNKKRQQRLRQQQQRLGQQQQHQRCRSDCRGFFCEGSVERQTKSAKKRTPAGEVSAVGGGKKYTWCLVSGTHTFFFEGA